jgi:heme/copper-type cytochrome/quinol oxidase subunit 2
MTASPPGQEQGPAIPGKPKSSLHELAENRAAVFATLFLVTGCLGVPLLWISSRFSRLERIVWSVVVTLYTAALIALVVAVCIWAYRRALG